MDEFPMPPVAQPPVIQYHNGWPLPPGVHIHQLPPRHIRPSNQVACGSNSSFSSNK